MGSGPGLQTALGRLPDGWRLRHIRDLALKVGSGATPRGGDATYLSQREQFALVRSQNVFDRHLSSESLAFISNDAADKLKGVHLQSGDVLLNITGDGVTFARACIVPTEILPACVNQHVSIIRVRQDLCDARFLLSYLVHPQTKKYIESFNSGGSRRAVTKAHIESFVVPIPPLTTQQRIADILSNYDDLIENNRRRIQLLEESARLLYKEWFVHLRFPGHEHVKVIDGAPEGWRSAALKDLTTKIGSGATPKGGAAAYKTEGITLIRSLNVYDYRFESDGLAFIDDNQAERLSNVVVEPLDVLLNITGASVARCCMVQTHQLPARVNQHVMIIRADSAKISPHYVLNFINSYQEKQRLLSIARSGGATREALTKNDVSDIQVRIPPPYLLEQFDEVASALFRQGQTLSRQNLQLARARDLLLPRLMNGELAV